MSLPWLPLHTNKIMCGNFAHTLKTLFPPLKYKHGGQILKIQSFPSSARLRETPERQTNAGCYHDPSRGS